MNRYVEAGVIRFSVRSAYVRLNVRTIGAISNLFDCFGFQTEIPKRFSVMSGSGGHGMRLSQGRVFLTRAVRAGRKGFRRTFRCAVATAAQRIQILLREVHVYPGHESMKIINTSCLDESNWLLNLRKSHHSLPGDTAESSPELSDLW